MNTNTNNQTIKNMELMLQEIDKGIKNRNIHSIKTLSESYNNLLKEIRRIIFSDVKKMQDEVTNIYRHKNSFERFISKINSELALAITDSKHKDSYHYTIILERFNKSLRDISEFKEVALLDNTKKEYEVNPVIQELLELSIKSGTLVTFHNEAHRGMGKTTALIKKAHELDVVLVVGMQVYAKNIQEQAEEMGLKVEVVSGRETSLPQYRKKMIDKGFLVDEMLNKEQLKSLKGYKLLGGFTNL